MLHVEDDSADARLVAELLRRHRVAVRLFRAYDGEEAMDFLRPVDRGPQHPRHPDLILLDLNLPGKHGLELLAEVKADKELKAIPVVILTNSEDPEDVRRAYESYANCYISKPFDLPGVQSVVDALGKFWLEDAALPVY